jgi:hypothetical protein
VGKCSGAHPTGGGGGAAPPNQNLRKKFSGHNSVKSFT